MALAKLGAAGTLPNSTRLHPRAQGCHDPAQNASFLATDRSGVGANYW
ncbi:MAG: hypothetical protein WB763_21935 [Terriglobia bacterium]